MPNKGFFSALNASQRSLFISVREALIKIAEDTGDSYAAIAKTLLRIAAEQSDVHWDEETQEFEEEDSYQSTQVKAQHASMNLFSYFQKNT